MSPVSTTPDHENQVAWTELRPVLHEEVNRLPEKYRMPIILSYLEGKTNEEVAGVLGWPVGTVKGRLSRARELLRSRLSRRGLALSAAFICLALSQDCVLAEAVPTSLIDRTLKRSVAGPCRRRGPVPGRRRPADRELLAYPHASNSARAWPLTIGPETGLRLRVSGY